jgi:hypothetical protein
MDGLNFVKAMINKESLTLLVTLIGSTSVAYLLYKRVKQSNNERDSNELRDQL